MTKESVLSSNNMIQENQPTPVKNLDEMKRMVHDMSQKNFNIKDIVKKKFCINGQIIGLNPTKVKKINSEIEQLDLPKKEPSHVELLKLFKDGVSRTNAVIKTKCTFEEVNKAYQQFVEFENKTEVPKWFIDGIFLQVQRIHRNTTKYENVFNTLREAVDESIKFRSFTYSCKRCGLPMMILGPEWPDIKRFLISEGWRHDVCP